MKNADPSKEKAELLETLRQLEREDRPPAPPKTHDLLEEQLDVLTQISGYLRFIVTVLILEIVAGMIYALISIFR